MNKELADKIKIFTGICVIIVILLVMSIAFKEEINSVEAFRAYIDKFGVFAPIALIAFQAFQVVVPMFPGQFGYAVGTIAFGVHAGFWCNYIGICLGSFIAYVLARKYGVSLVLAFFSQKNSIINGREKLQKVVRMIGFSLLQHYYQCFRMICYAISPD